MSPRDSSKAYPTRGARPRTGPGRFGTVQEWAEVRAMWDAEIPTSIIAERTGFSVPGIMNRSYRHRWPKRGSIRIKGVAPSRWNTEGRVLWDAMKSVEEIAKVLGCAPARVHQKKRELGWPDRPHWTKRLPPKPKLVPTVRDSRMPNTAPTPEPTPIRVTVVDDSHCPRCRSELPASKVCSRCLEDFVANVRMEKVA